MKKIGKKTLSVALAVIMCLSMLVTLGMGNTFTSSAASGDTIYLESSSWTAPNCYMWSGTGTVSNGTWPGVAMTKVEGNIWSYTLDGDYENVIFNQGSDQTDDMKFPGANKIYSQAGGSWSDYIVSSDPFVQVSQEDGTKFSSDTLSVTLTLKNATSGTYSIDGGAEKSFTSETTIMVGQGLKGNENTTLTVSATGDGPEYNKTFTYTKTYKAPSGGTSGEDGHTTEALDGKYATNPNDQYGGKDVTISSAADWKDSMIIAQGAANDDANVFKGPHEYPVYDTYSLYAAWDNDNVYIGWQFVNVRDITASDQGGAGTNEAKPYNADMPQMLALDLGLGSGADGSMDVAGEYVWGETIDYTTNIDVLMAFSSKPGVGTPGYFTANADGKFSYTEGIETFKDIGISYEYENGFFGSSMYGINANGYTGLLPEQYFDESSSWVDFTTLGHKESLDTLYTMTLPLDTLGISKAELEQNGIGVMHISIYGSSAVNTIPMDPSCLDAATDAYSADPSSTAEKEDTDNITVPLARVGAPLSTGSEPVEKDIAVNFGADVSSPQSTGTAISLSADAYNGTEPYTYKYYVNNSLISSNSTANWTPTSAGTYTLKCVVTDSTGKSATVTKDFVIEGGGTVGPTNPPETQPGMTGDVNGDGKVTIMDVFEIQRYMADMITLSATQLDSADVDNNGSVTVNDQLNIQKYLADIISTL